MKNTATPFTLTVYISGKLCSKEAEDKILKFFFKVALN